MVSVSPEEVAEIDQIQLQRRKYHWVEFRNVSLESEHRTDVKVRDAGGVDRRAIPSGLDEEQTRTESNGFPEQKVLTFSHRIQLAQALLDASREFCP